MIENIIYRYFVKGIFEISTRFGCLHKYVYTKDSVLFYSASIIFINDNVYCVR